MSEVVIRVKDKVEAELHRPDVGVRIIIVLKLLKATAMIAVAATAFSFIHRDVHAAAEGVVRWLGFNPAGPRLERWLSRLIGLSPLRLEEIGVGALLVAAVMATEAWGLHRRRVWAEWLTVGVTSLLIPLEVYELAIGASVGKALTLVVNVAIVIYLARNRRLFSRGRIGAWFAARRRR
jgi:uncharacterized membrane protein (DUF2068 family)